MLESRWLAACVLLCGAIFVPPFVARALQRPQPGSQAPTAAADAQPPTFHTEANYVRVDAYPMKDGAPVLDLTRAEFDLLDNGRPQTIDRFEHILVAPGGPQETRREPNTPAESREMLNDPHARAFVVFLDTYHVEVGGSHRIRGPLVRALDQTIGERDLVAVMTPEMSVRDLSFARRATTIDGMLTRHWPWGERDQINSKDAAEDEYWACYPGTYVPPPGCQNREGDQGVATEMIERRREKRTLDALNDLVRFLRGLREERTAVIVVSDGWRLFGQDAHLAHPIGCRGPGDDVRVDPRTGRLTSQGSADSVVSSARCEGDRLALAQIDNAADFQRTLQQADGANVSFYPIDPRGLVVFDEPIVPVRGSAMTSIPPQSAPAADRRAVADRLRSLRTMAEETDGLAVVDNNDLAAGLHRIVSDLTSYYLLGYYASGALDGKFHRITVRVKRPGVQVRARRGYLAASDADVAAARAAVASAGPAAGRPSPSGTGPAAAAEAAVAKLAGVERRAGSFTIQAAAGWKADADGALSAGFWLVGEVPDRIPGADLDVLVTDASGRTVAAGHGRVQPGTTGALVSVSPAATLAPGEYTVSARGRTPSGVQMASVKVLLPAAPLASGAVFVRRGPSSGNREVPTADLRFRRSERVVIEVPAPGATHVGGRLLDRHGADVPVPVAAALRDAADGTRWATAELALVPLAPGEYVVEVSTGGGFRPADTAAAGPRPAPDTRTLVAFRVVE